MTLVVLGLDGLDARHVEEFGVDAFDLETAGEMETVAYEREEPHTTQVWPTMATGLPPEDHGIGVGRASEWSNPLVEWASRTFAPKLPLEWRVSLGDVATQVTGDEWDFATVDGETFLDPPGRFVHNWPGVDNSGLEEVWNNIEYIHNSDAPQESFDREMWALAGEKFGWLFELLNHPAALLAVQIHLVDSFGHAYATQYDHYAAQYRRVGEYVRELRDRLGESDDLLVVSDHGIQVEWFDDATVAEHSWHAFSASTLPTRPSSVLDVREWVEDAIGPHERRFAEADRTALDLPTETLRELGYIE